MLSQNKFTICSIGLLFSILLFVGGYWLGAHHTSKQFVQINTSLLKSKNTLQNADDDKQGTMASVWSAERNKNSISESISPSDEANEEHKENDLADANSASILALPSNASIIEILDYLATLSLSNSEEYTSLFAPTLNELKKKLNESPENLQILMDYFVDLDINSQNSYYIPSLIRGSNSPDKTRLILSTVEQLVNIGSADSNMKMLNLISNTGAHFENDRLVEHIKNIALHEQTQAQNRLYALDLLKPYQLNEAEKQHLVNEFSMVLDEASDNEKGYLIENIVRFSKKQERESLANDYLSSNHDMATRIAVISTLYTGTVNNSERIKKTLFEIAQNTNDPLQKHAYQALMGAFEITNEEYSQLQNNNN